MSAHVIAPPSAKYGLWLNFHVLLKLSSAHSYLWIEIVAMHFVKWSGLGSGLDHELSLSELLLEQVFILNTVGQNSSLGMPQHRLLTG